MGEGTWILSLLLWLAREDIDVKDEDDVINLDGDEDVEDETEENDKLERPEGWRGKIFGLGRVGPGVFGCVDGDEDGVD